MNEFMKKILNEMCLRVGRTIDDIDLKSPEWYMEEEWRLAEQDRFKEWLINYLKNNKVARDNLMRIPSNHKRDIENFAFSFIMDYGWKNKI